MSADAIGLDGGFTRGLLQPSLPVPLDVKYQSSKRYAVYRNNVTVGLVRAMEANFPVVRRLLGEVYFAGLAREFVQAHPPQNPMLYTYGVKFGTFLQGYADLAQYPYLADVAAIERLYLEAYHEADSDFLQASTLAVHAPEDLMGMQFVVHPALRMAYSRFAVGSIYLANRNVEAGEVDPYRAEWVLLTRPNQTVEMRVITPAVAAFITALRRGDQLAQAVDAAFDVDETFDFSAALGLIITAGAMQSTIEV